MPETSITAHLPTVDIELMRRTLPEQNAELITVQIRATPSFEAMERWLAQPFMQPFALPAVDADAFQWWADMMRAAWQPWLAMNPALTLFLPSAGARG